jgi:hypothetical protein
MRRKAEFTESVDSDRITESCEPRKDDQTAWTTLWGSQEPTSCGPGPWELDASPYLVALSSPSATITTEILCDPTSSPHRSGAHQSPHQLNPLPQNVSGINDNQPDSTNLTGKVFGVVLQAKG